MFCHHTWWSDWWRTLSTNISEVDLSAFICTLFREDLHQSKYGIGSGDWREISMKQSVNKFRWINFWNLCGDLISYIVGLHGVTKSNTNTNINICCFDKTTNTNTNIHDLSVPNTNTIIIAQIQYKHVSVRIQCLSCFCLQMCHLICVFIKQMTGRPGLRIPPIKCLGCSNNSTAAVGCGLWGLNTHVYGT